MAQWFSLTKIGITADGLCIAIEEIGLAVERLNKGYG
jgi:hypothetical protein